MLKFKYGIPPAKKDFELSLKLTIEEPKELFSLTTAQTEKALKT
jgi:hypothetical protein